MLNIVTHGGNFHADEVCAISILILLYGRENINIIRTRKQDIINEADIVIDVGGIYDYVKNRYDHHQSTFNEIKKNYNNTGVLIEQKLASCGLIWFHFGKQLIDKLKKDKYDIDTQFVIEYVYFNYLYHIDAVDYGKSSKSAMAISSIIRSMNGTDTSNNENQMVLFNRALDITIPSIYTFIEECFRKENNDIIKYDIEMYNAAKRRWVEMGRPRYIIFKGNMSKYNKYIDAEVKSHIHSIIIPDNRDDDIWLVERFKKFVTTDIPNYNKKFVVYQNDKFLLVKGIEQAKIIALCCSRKNYPGDEIIECLKKEKSRQKINVNNYEQFYDSSLFI